MDQLLDAEGPLWALREVIVLAEEGDHDAAAACARRIALEEYAGPLGRGDPAALEALRRHERTQRLSPLPGLAD